ncbi:MAG: hypothetical protein F6J93_11720 [Oscillatoria sp. SIO1A7]|nr:hypothetical protein [Oscillatoria sp. SIO1A7]
MKRLGDSIPFDHLCCITGSQLELKAVGAACAELLSCWAPPFPQGELRAFLPNSQFPIPNSQFPIPNSQFPIPHAQCPTSTSPPSNLLWWIGVVSF